MIVFKTLMLHLNDLTGCITKTESIEQVDSRIPFAKAGRLIREFYFFKDSMRRFKIGGKRELDKVAEK